MNFIVVFSPRRPAPDAPFERAMRNARLLGHSTPSRVLETDWVQAAVFPRESRGVGGAIAVDPASGSWLLAAGTWLAGGGLRSGDEPKLLERWLAVGARRLASELDGQFCLVIADARTRETWVITDPVCGGFAFRRELAGGVVALAGSSLLLASLDDSPLDAVGLQEYLRNGIVYEERTIFSRVARVPAASVVGLDERGAVRSVDRWWSPESIARDRLSGDEAAEAMHGALAGAVRRAASLGGRVSCDLTAGYDSRSVVAAARAARVDFATNVTGAAGSVDVERAAEVARAGGLEHRWLPTEPPREISQVKQAVLATDGEYDPVDYARIRGVHARLRAGGLDVSLNGAGGEIARGLWWQFFLPQLLWRGPAQLGHLLRKRFSDTGADSSLFRAPDRLDLAEHFGALLRRATGAARSLPVPVQVDAIYLSVRLRGWHGRIASATSRHWPVLSPFLLRAPMETALSIRWASRFRSLAVRRMLVRFAPDMASVPVTQGYPAMPLSLRNAHRFLAAMPERFGMRALRKLSGRPGAAAAPPSAASLAPRVHLWLQEETCRLLRPRDMRLASVFDEGALARFLEASRRRDFAFDAMWNRILGVEEALQVLSRIRALSRPAAVELESRA